jgi:hypothetical protein
MDYIVWIYSSADRNYTVILYLALAAHLLGH